MLITGNVAFSSLTKYDEFNGQSTGAYTLTIQMDDSEAEALEAVGIRLKEYEGIPQRKFKSKFGIKVVDTEDRAFTGEIPRGSKVRLSFQVGPEHPVHGPSTYLKAVRVLEVAEDSSADEDGF